MGLTGHCLGGGSMNRSIWFGYSTKNEKPWGFEVEWSGIYKGKQIFMNANSRTSLKFNTHKAEALYITSGKILLEYADEAHFADPIQHPSRSKVLSAGSVVNIQAGCPYRMTALEESTIFEISQRAAQSERVVLEDDYGRETSQEKYKWIFNSAVEKR